VIPDRLTAALSDRYRIERELGAGGMATVYLAHDLKHDRKVAIKVLRQELAASLGADRFLREVHIAAQLQHPHILTLIDSGEADGFLYYVMPYVDGETLRARIARDGEFPVADVVRILREVADALAHAHGHGVVHRDVKPENIMLSGRHALVMDFGVAKAVSEATGVRSLTTVGVALGTPTYMAPEQATADPHVDHRADIYALGVIAYELLTGRPPFTGNTPQQVIAAHVTQAPDPVTRHRAAVPAPLAELVMRCLEKKPADRPQSAQQVLNRFEELATPTGGMTPAGTAPHRIGRCGDRRRRSWAVLWSWWSPCWAGSGRGAGTERPVPPTVRCAWRWSPSRTLVPPIRPTLPKGWWTKYAPGSPDFPGSGSLPAPAPRPTGAGRVPRNRSGRSWGCSTC
jgi:serine/threonine-protein kinase